MLRSRVVFLTLFLFVVALGSLAQSESSVSDTAKSAKKAPRAPLKWLKGTISDDGKSFTADKDKSTWTIANPDDVRGHEGHHVKVQAHVYPTGNSMHVMKIESFQLACGERFCTRHCNRRCGNKGCDCQKDGG